MPETHEGLPILHLRTQAAFERWLAKHHTRDTAVWLMFAKKNSARQTLSYVEAREAAIIWGWIDGLKNAFDEDGYLLRFTARRSRSKWSLINREIAERLLEAGRMAEPGVAQVDAAKADGRWDAAYPSSATIEEPADFLAALGRSKPAKAFYPTISRAARFQILVRIHDAKRADTRKRRIEGFVALLANGETP
ncbi:YdeI/OmpD-associated family protein [Enhygromyxa salina]|uniref:Bacteriocin-protection protein n=1 Tax=Enhygromyxa salina TaxID=215803 RepID=A0A2S9YYH0_9BACT|nr:YdeI/OmpD-associated family protein [Enhygromyxa salina]PRQ10109.1 hypothetical protein ENSA7_01540 [Enhygromyxa salina]